MMDVVEALLAQGVQPEQYHPEAGPGQQELSVRFTDALRAAGVELVAHDGGGITGAIEFDDKGDPKKATYLIYQVGKEWNDNKLIKRLEIATPAMKKQ